MKKRLRKKNPIDFQLLNQFEINAPLGLPDDPSEAFNLGAMLGTLKVISLFEGLEHKITLIDLYKLHDIRQIAKGLNFSKSLPSDAFMAGIIYGINGNPKLFNEGKIAIERRQKLYKMIQNHPLYKKYADTRPRIKKSIASSVKSYFGLKS